MGKLSKYYNQINISKLDIETLNNVKKHYKSHSISRFKFNPNFISTINESFFFIIEANFPYEFASNGGKNGVKYSRIENLSFYLDNNGNYLGSYVPVNPKFNRAISMNLNMELFNENCNKSYRLINRDVKNKDKYLNVDFLFNVKNSDDFIVNDSFDDVKNKFDELFK